MQMEVMSRAEAGGVEAKLEVRECRWEQEPGPRQVEMPAGAGGYVLDPVVSTSPKALRNVKESH